MKQRPSWEASQEIPHILCNPKVYYRIHKSQPPVSILSQIDPIHASFPQPTSPRSILMLSCHLRLRLPSGLLPSGFPTKTLYAHLLSPFRATCAAYLSLLDLITPVTLSLLGPNILLSTLFSNPSACVPPSIQGKTVCSKTMSCSVIFVIIAAHMPFYSTENNSWGRYTSLQNQSSRP